MNNAGFVANFSARPCVTSLSTRCVLVAQSKLPLLHVANLLPNL